jgi:uncharacterized damage-inducible protein DinB
LIRDSDPKPIRIFLQDGLNDNRGVRGEGADATYTPDRDWHAQNIKMVAALTGQGYDVNYTWGIGTHSNKQGGAILPDMLRWLWRDYARPPDDPRDSTNRMVLVPPGAAGSAKAQTPSPAAGAAEPAALASTVQPWWTMITTSFVAAAEAMPQEKYDFTPKDGAFDGVRSFAQQVKHVACANQAFFDEIEGKQPPPDCERGGPNPAKTKAELVSYLKESFEYGQTVFKKLTPANALDPVSGRYGGPSTRLGIMTLAIWHASDHYGQLVVYLRLNGIVPPASR